MTKLQVLSSQPEVFRLVVIAVAETPRLVLVAVEILVVEIGGGNSGGGGPRWRQKYKPLDPNEEFDKMVKATASAKDVVDKLVALQKKKDKEAHGKYLKENVYSSKGLGIAEGINDIASTYQTADHKELDEAKKKLRGLQEAVRFSTSGKDNELLTKATLALEKELETESKKRNTALGKIGQFLNKENIDAASIVTGILGDSPMVGLMTKGVLEMVRSRREKAQKRKADALKVDPMRSLPRPNDPKEIDNKDVKLTDTDDIARKLSGMKSQNHIHQSLEELLSQGKITPQQHAQLRNQLLPKGFQPSYQGVGQATSPQPVTAQAPSQAASQAPQPVPSPTPVQTPPNVVQMPLKAAEGPEEPDYVQYGPHRVSIPDVQGYNESRRRAPTKQEQEDNPGGAHFDREAINRDQQAAWMNMLTNRAKDDAEAKRTAPPAPRDPQLNDPELFPTAEEDEAYRRKPGRVPFQGIADDYRSPMQLQKKKREQGQVIEMPSREEAPTMTMAAKTLQPPEVLEDQELHPEKTSGNVVSILSGMKKDEDKESNEFDTHNNNNPFTKLELLSQQQLAALKEIIGIMKGQMDNAELGKEAGLRETKDASPLPVGGEGGEGGGIAKALGKLKGGEGGGMMSTILEFIMGIDALKIAFGVLTKAGNLLAGGFKWAFGGIKSALGGLKNLITGGGKAAGEGAEALAGEGAETAAAGGEAAAAGGEAAAAGGAVERCCCCWSGC